VLADRDGFEGQLDGVFVPMFTPFTPDAEAVNEEQLRTNVRFLINSGVRILNPAGTTGEFWTLDEREHQSVLRIVLEEAARLCPEALVVAGTTGRNVNESIKLARFAVDHGARIVLIAPSYYLPLGNDDLVAYYKAIAENIDAAIMMYDIPVATGVRMGCDVVARICEQCPQIVALKTALPADTPREFERLVKRFEGRLHVLSGMGAYFSPFVYMTGVAGITDTMGNAVPEFGLTLHKLARAKRWEDMNNLYQDAFDALEIEQIYGKAGLKEIGNCCGHGVGPTRYPIANILTPADREDIFRRLSRWSYTRPFLRSESHVAAV
jgi:4-hydroxy-tetrahydrodipicolinate synthase